MEVVADQKGHTLIGFANPFLVCYVCKQRTKYWHDGIRCGCNTYYWNSPCGHKAEVKSLCPTWNPVDGCTCKDVQKQHKVRAAPVGSAVTLTA